MKPARRSRVLFVCIGNACRSPMAEAITRRDAADIIEPSSAGLYPLGYLPDLTHKTLTANGCSIEGLYSKPISASALREADVIVNLSGWGLGEIFKEPIGVEGPSCEIEANIEEWDVADPYGSDPDLYQQIFREIEVRVQQLAVRLRAVGRAAHA